MYQLSLFLLQLAWSKYTGKCLGEMRRRSLVVKVKVKVKERIVLREIHLRTTGRHLSMGSHSVICHPTSAFTPTGQVGTRFIDPVGMKGWVGLVAWLHTEMVYPSTGGHPSEY